MPSDAFDGRTPVRLVSCPSCGQSKENPGLFHLKMTLKVSLHLISWTSKDPAKQSEVVFLFKSEPPTQAECFEIGLSQTHLEPPASCLSFRADGHTKLRAKVSFSFLLQVLGFLRNLCELLLQGAYKQLEEILKLCFLQIGICVKAKSPTCFLLERNLPKWREGRQEKNSIPTRVWDIEKRLGRVMPPQGHGRQGSEGV